MKFEYEDKTHKYEVSLVNGHMVDISRQPHDAMTPDFYYYGPYDSAPFTEGVRGECERLLKLKAFW